MRYETIKTQIVDELKKIYDPEIPVNLYDLGLIYGINCARESEGARCAVTMTLTSANCPVSESIVNQVQNIGSLVDGLTGLDVNLVFDPPWDKEKMSDEAKLQLGMM